MTINFKTTAEKIETQDVIRKLRKYNGDIIDLSNLNLFDATKTIIITSAYYFHKNPEKKVRYKVSAPNIQNLLTDIPMSNMIELV